MKLRTQIILVGALLIVLAALARRGARSDSANRNRGTCCSFMPAPQAMPIPIVTNGVTIISNTNTPAATNLTPPH
jgi:hypothetical protein